LKKYPKKIELLAPVGSLPKLQTALAFGADAVYLGAPDFSLRVGENKFTLPQIQQAISICRAAKKKIYLTTNTYPRDTDFPKLEKFLKKIRATPPDAFIFSDLGVLRVIQKYLPKTPLHLSVQANSVNSEAIKVWWQLGVRRVILARELSLKEIQKIIRNNPRMEFETFVHGSICMSYSGRCLLSMFLSGRDANRGQCTQPCRWEFKMRNKCKMQNLKCKTGVNFRDNFGAGAEFALEEEQRPGEYFPLEEDAQGSYILNSRDLCLIEKIPELVGAGVCSFKIEGRNKTVGYLAAIVHAYRRALDDFLAKKPFDRKLLEAVGQVGNRKFTLGFFDGSLQNLQNYERSGIENPQSFLGLVEKFEDGFVSLEPKNRFEKGDKIEALIPRAGLKKLKIREIRDEKFKEILTAHGGQREKVWVRLGVELPPFTLLRRRVKSQTGNS